MKLNNPVLVVTLIIAAAVGAADRLYLSGMQKKFDTLEKNRIETANKLATAKILQENLNHVKDLVFDNIAFGGVADSLTPETRFFSFLTTCVNDLKMNLVSVTPQAPRRSGRTTTYAYDIEVEGDYFSFGELCAKFENSRRIITIESFDLTRRERGDGEGERRGVSAKMKVNTYSVRK